VMVRLKMLGRLTLGRAAFSEIDLPTWECFTRWERVGPRTPREPNRPPIPAATRVSGPGPPCDGRM